MSLQVRFFQDSQVAEILKNDAYTNTLSDGTVYAHVENTQSELAIFISLADVPLSYIEGVPFEAAYGLAHLLGAPKDGIEIVWPQTVIDSSSNMKATISAQAGYAKGVFVVVQIVVNKQLTAEQICVWKDTLVAELQSWQDDIRQKRAVAGPLSRCLHTYFDYVATLGEPCVVQDKQTNKLMLTGIFSGLDMWGNARVIDEKGTEHTVSFQTAALIPCPGATLSE